MIRDIRRTMGSGFIEKDGFLTKIVKMVSMLHE